MSRLDPVSAQLVARPHRLRAVLTLRGGTWAVLALAPILAVWTGLRVEANPVDCAARALAELPLALLCVDLWALGIALFRRPGRTPLWARVKVPLILAAFHMGVGLWARHLASFDVLYRLEPAGELRALYVVRGGIATLLGLLALISLIAALLEGKWVHRALALEDPVAAGEPEAPAPAPAPAPIPDMPAGPEHVYEAQVILHSLGYGVGEIDGKLRDVTRAALRQFQSVCNLEPSGEVTVLTMSELRHRWVAQREPRPGQSIVALYRHVARSAVGRIAGWWRRKG